MRNAIPNGYSETSFWGSEREFHFLFPSAISAPAVFVAQGHVLLPAQLQSDATREQTAHICWTLNARASLRRRRALWFRRGGRWRASFGAKSTGSSFEVNQALSSVSILLESLHYASYWSEEGLFQTDVPDSCNSDVKIHPKKLCVNNTIVEFLKESKEQTTSMTATRKKNGSQQLCLFGFLD